VAVGTCVQQAPLTHRFYTGRRLVLIISYVANFISDLYAAPDAAAFSRLSVQRIHSYIPAGRARVSTLAFNFGTAENV
jgi:hypothetical protein